MSRRWPAFRPTSSGRARDDDPVATFVRGVTVGAFVGAVIAGSTAWHRIRGRIADRTAARQPGPGFASPRHDPVGPPGPDGDASRQ